MIHPLPAETVLEAKERARRATAILFVLLVVVYALFANLMVFVVFLISNEYSVRSVRQIAGWLFGITTAGAFLTAWIHFLTARSKKLDQILDQIGGREADSKDEYHARFINIVHEAEAALGGRAIRAAVIPSLGLNAFSIEDGSGNAAIGATEGLLARLDRSELSAVVAHEAAHLAHEDSKLATTACSLFGVFGAVRSLLSQGRGSGRSNVRIRTRASGQIVLVYIAVWIIATIGQFFTKLIYMGISRKREFMADANGVEMSKDPLSLAEALYKISRGYRGQIDVPEGFSAIFILNPAISRLDEEGNPIAELFSTHPPVSARLEKLLTWAKADVNTLIEAEKRAVSAAGTTSVTGQVLFQTGGAKPVPAGGGTENMEAPQFYVHHEENWKGPYTPAQMMALGFVQPLTMIRPADQDEIVRAGEHPIFIPLFQNPAAQGSGYACPRCHVSLIETQYEGAPVFHCAFCGGHLLQAGVLERIIARREKGFSEYEIEMTKSVWQAFQTEKLKQIDSFPQIQCAICGDPTFKSFHTSHTKVVIDRCLNPACGAIWCDGKELETIQILIESAGNQI